MAGEGKVKFTNSLQFTISIILLFVTLTILLGFAGFQFMNAKKRMYASLENFSENTSMRMSQYLANPMWAVEKNVIESLIDSEMLDKNVFGVVVYDSNGKAVITGKGRDASWKAFSTSNIFSKVKLSKEELFVKSKDIYMPGIKDKKLGVVKVFVTKQFAKKDLYSFLTTNITAIIILNLIMIAAISISLRRLLLAPLDGLIDVTEKMSMGDLKAGISISSKNEIGVLAESIERMRQSMILAFKRLQKK